VTDHTRQLAARQLAARQLAALEQVSGGAFEVLAQPDADDDRFLVSLDTHGIPNGAGIRIRGREKFRIRVPDTFPYQPPTVFVDHRRWMGAPHVQWGNLLCLYAASSVEWNPADGMRGLVGRLTTWLERAAEGTLDPAGQPLHPPVTYPSAEAGLVIVHPDLGTLVPWPTGAVDPDMNSVVIVFAWCTRDSNHVEVLEWLNRLDAFERVLSDDLKVVDDEGRPYFLIPTMLISNEIGWEYPDKARDLAAGLEESGYTREQLLTNLTMTSRLNRTLRRKADDDANLDADPIAMLIGTPSRRIDEAHRLAHLVGWKLNELGGRITSLLSGLEAGTHEELTAEVRQFAHEWLDIADVHWMQVHEMRPEVTNRRDRGTAASWLYGKRVLVLGCGALGAPVAEHCVRAGVEGLTVLDAGVVTPGILVRQPYSYADIGHAKSRVLAQRLNNITREPVVKAICGNALPTILDADFDPTAFDLIIDATADVGVRAALEGARWQRRDDWPPVVTMIIGHQANRGLVTVSRAGATGAGHDVLRRVAIRARGSEAPGWGDVADDFFPHPPRTEMFFPEPGCSAPTFVGSAAEVSALASHMLTEALRSLTAVAHFDRSTMTAIAIRLASDGAGKGADTTSVLTWNNDLVCIDPDTGYEIRVAAEAVAEMRAETRRGNRVRGPEVETGGMLLGAFDDSTGVVNIDLATGPSPDSRLSSVYFDHGTAGTQEVIDHHLRRTANVTGFVGMWHTHPNGKAYPSETDEAGMAALTTFAGTGRRALMMILAGTPCVWEAWRGAAGMPSLYVQVVHRNASPVTDHVSGRVQAEPPPGTYFAGGYAYPSEGSPIAWRLSWWPHLVKK
jgi:integrative and conjugative element protein (TIGR02256 family)